MLAVQEIELLEPGIYFDYPASKYHRLPYVSNSYLGLLKECPAAARIAWPTTDAMIFGQMFHSYVLEYVSFNQEFYFLSEIAGGNSAIAKRLRANAVLDNLDKTQVSFDQMEDLKAMKASVMCHPFAKSLVANCYVEVTLIWDHVTPSGVVIRMKCRIDCIPRTRRGEPGLLVDLKSAKAVDPKGFRYAILDRGYYRQAAIYLDAINTLSRLYAQMGLEFPFADYFDDFIFIAVAKKPPFRVECYDLSEASYQEGQVEYLQLLEVERSCRQAKGGPFYPPYQSAGMVTLDVGETLQHQRKLLEI